MSTAPDPYDAILSLTSEDTLLPDRRRALRDFARGLGWRPSYPLLDSPQIGPIAKAHLVVEHGLEPSAVITFLDSNIRAAELSVTDYNNLLSISYNNLVDWHLYVERDVVTFNYNRLQPPIIDRQYLSRYNFAGVQNRDFERVAGEIPKPSLPNVEESIIRTISNWKRNLSAELGYDVPNSQLSALFNAILFVRAAEDQRRRSESASLLRLSTASASPAPTDTTLRAWLASALSAVLGSNASPNFIDLNSLSIFDSLDPSTASSLISDFYRNPYAPYQYDFSIMSKHALSRIYEHYSSLLQVEYSPQSSFFPALPEEEWNRSFGSIYTPEFIARFFARYLREQMPPSVYRRLRTIDPACGSGIFLRTLLELQCDPLHDGVTSQTIADSFAKVVGIDRDENAVQASRLSLSLLHLSLTGSLPTELNITHAESVWYFMNHASEYGSYDSVIVNPPFIPIERQDDALRNNISSFMGDDAKGRTDTYLAFLRLGLELLKPGAYGLFVLPRNFLLASAAAPMRRRLAAETQIQLLADLSAIPVFGDIGVYVVLLIFQKNPQSAIPLTSNATIIRCQDLVGMALEDALEGQHTSNSSYSIYDVGQEEFQSREWIILPPVETNLRRRLREFPTLDQFAHVRQGIITGADDVFIVDERDIDPAEHSIFVPFLPDRQIQRYVVPRSTGKVVIYPFDGDRRISQEELSDRFPRTWQYLLNHRDQLDRRSSVARGDVEWWEPAWPRSPKVLLRPKILSPNLVLVPRFSLDETGRYAVTRSPYIVPREDAAAEDMLLYLLVILNSPACYWYIASHSHKYSRGYSKLELRTLRPVPIPDPAMNPAATLRLIQVGRELLAEGSSARIEPEIELLVSDLYGLTVAERRALGIET